MRKKRVMVIGSAGCGKSSLIQFLEGRYAPLRKAPEPIYGEKTIDCPGGYVENTYMYKHLIAIAQDASHVVLVIDASKQMDVYSPGFAQVLGKPTVGVITKLDLAPENEMICRERLRRAGVQGPVFCLNASEGTGVQAIKGYLFHPEREEASQ